MCRVTVRGYGGYLHGCPLLYEGAGPLVNSKEITMTVALDYITDVPRTIEPEALVELITAEVTKYPLCPAIDIVSSLHVSSGGTRDITLIVGSERLKPWEVVVFYYDGVPNYCILYYEADDKFKEIGRTADLNLVLAVVCGGVRFRL